MNQLLQKGPFSNIKRDKNGNIHSNQSSDDVILYGSSSYPISYGYLDTSMVPLFPHQLSEPALVPQILRREHEGINTIFLCGSFLNTLHKDQT